MLRTSAALLVLLLASHAAAGAPAQGSRADYERAAALSGRFGGIDVGERFRGRWIDGHRLWRLRGEGDERALEIIDPEGSPRRVAAAASAVLGGGGGEVLGVRGAVDGGAGVLVLRSDGAVIGWTPGEARGRVLDADAEGARAFDARLGAGPAPRRSRGRGGATELVFVNGTAEALELEWVTTDGGRRGYGTIEPGGSRHQGTYAGHVFVARGEDGEPRAWVRAVEGPAVARIGAEEDPGARGADRDAGRRGQGQGSGSGRGQDRPRPAWRVRIEDGDLVAEARRGGRRVVLGRADGDAAFGGPAQWAPDGRHVVCWRITPAQERPVHIVESSPDDRLQPRLVTYDYLKAGDRIEHRWPVVVRVPREGEPEVVDCGVEELCPTPWSMRQGAWSADGERYSFVYNRRGHRVVSLVSIDPEAGEARAVIEEAPETFVDYAAKTYLHRFPPTEDGAEDVLWMTERSGWNHLILVDGRTGEVKREVTSGEWVVRAVDRVDDDARRAHLRIMGHHPDQDPYHVHHAVVDVDTGELRVLTEGDGTHRVEVSPDGRWLLDRWSRVDLAEQVELRPVVAGAGRPMTLASGSLHGFEAAGWRAPERFVAKGRDGRTDIWGIVVRPTNHDPTKRYPVIEKIYAGPHDHHVPKSFRRLRNMNVLAELGFIVVQIDGMGTNWRSKAFHDVAWKNLGDAGFPDRVAWLRALAEHDPSVDLGRVGIYGGSAGGQNALRALIDHHELYDAAVADCGCHDNRMDKIWWNELWMSWPVGPHYEESSNVVHAHRMEGDLLLVVGELDRNVDPASTMQVVDALVKADKDFELLVIPGAGHGAMGSRYGTRRMHDFFVRKLHGREPRWE